MQRVTKNIKPSQLCPAISGKFRLPWVDVPCSVYHRPCDPSLTTLHCLQPWLCFTVPEDIEFSHEATVLLIKGIRRRYKELSTNHRSRHQIYRDLHDEFTRHGYNYSVERIRRKWNNLLGTYKRLRRDPNPGKVPWEYLDVSVVVKLWFNLNLCMFLSIYLFFWFICLFVSSRLNRNDVVWVCECLWLNLSLPVWDWWPGMWADRWLIYSLFLCQGVLLVMSFQKFQRRECWFPLLHQVLCLRFLSLHVTQA